MLAPAAGEAGVTRRAIAAADEEGVEAAAEFGVAGSGVGVGGAVALAPAFNRSSDNLRSESRIHHT